MVRGPRGGIKKPLEIAITFEKGDELTVDSLDLRSFTSFILHEGLLTVRGAVTMDSKMNLYPNSVTQNKGDIMFNVPDEGGVK